MRRMRNNNLEIRIVGSSCRPQLLLLLLLLLIDVGDQSPPKLNGDS